MCVYAHKIGTPCDGEKDAYSGVRRVGFVGEERRICDVD